MDNSIVGLIIIAFVLFFLEIFVPGGILAIIGGILLIIASILAYEPWGIWGTLGIIAGGLAGGILMFFLEIKLLAKLPLGKSFIHDSTNNGTTQAEGDKSLVGATGTTLTVLLPTGRVKIDNQIFEATSLGGKIDRDAAIEVVRVKHLNLIVKEI